MTRRPEQYLDEGKRLIGFAYLVGGVGRYWENPTALTDEDSEKRRDTFYQARGGLGLNYVLPNRYTLDADLDYRFRYFDNHEIRNESDWRWFLGVNRNVGESNLALGVRGRVSYRGNGQYCNDYGIFGDWRYRVESVSQFNLGAEVRRRRYPTGPLRDRSRTIGELTTGWTHSFAEGRGTFSLNGRGGYEWATTRPEGNSSFFGAGGGLNFVITDRFDAFVEANWAHHVFSDETFADTGGARPYRRDAMARPYPGHLVAPKPGAWIAARRGELVDSRRNHVRTALQVLAARSDPLAGRLAGGTALLCVVGGRL